MRFNKKGFTVIEVLISVTILSLIMIALLSGTSQNLKVMIRGDENMFMQKEVSRILTDLYLEITSIGPKVFVDKYGDPWVSGEKNKEVTPVIIYLVDVDKNTKNGYEGLKFNKYGIDPISSVETVKYYFVVDPQNLAKRLMNKDKTGYIFRKLRGNHDILISEFVSDLHFIPQDGTTKGLKVVGEIAVKSKNGKIKRLPFSFLIRVESSYIAFEVWK